MSEILFDHIAIGMERLGDADGVLSDVLGGVQDYGGSSRAYRFRQWCFRGGGRLEALEPLGSDGFLRRFLHERGPGIHHVTFVVPSLREACDRAVAHGYEIVGRDESEPAWKEAFLHPKQALGIVVQMAETQVPRTELAAACSSASASSVAILGLRMRARAQERARRQWELLLGGQASSGSDGEIIYRWAGSPMRLLVEIDPSATEGAVAIEYLSEQPLALADAPHPVLGAVFSSGRQDVG